MEVPWSALAAGGPWVALGLAVISVIRGWLVPATTVALLLKRSEDWRAAWELSEQARALQAEQLSRLLEYARAADSVLRSLPTPNPAGDREPV